MSYQQYRPSQFKLLPDVVKNLLIINGLFFLASIVSANSFGKDLAHLLGLYYFESPNFEIWQYVTHIFMHDTQNFMHIFSNMFALWMFGSVLENYWGPKRFLIFYFVTGLGAAFIHTLTSAYDVHVLQESLEAFSQDPSVEAFISYTRKHVPPAIQIEYNFEAVANAWELQPHMTQQYAPQAFELMAEWIRAKVNTPTVGASGAVFGVLLAFGMLFPNSVIYLYFALPIKAKYFVILYGGFELFNAFQNNPQDNVAHFAHLGGMLFGFILIKYWSRSRKNFY